MYEKLQRFSILDGLLAAGLALLTVGIGVNLKAKTDQGNEVSVYKISPIPSNGTSPAVGKVKFEVAGEVMNQGVYELTKGSRIDDALIAAGGLGQFADREWVAKNINRAAMIADGSKIYIPRQQLTQLGGQATSINPTGVVLGAESRLVNINTAAVEELDKLQGIGPALASRIIDYREKNGGFKAVSEIKLVSGIGDKLYEQIKDLIEI